MRIHLNAGNDIETPVQMGDAILFCGVPAVNVVFCECVEVSCESDTECSVGGRISSALESKFQGKAEYSVHIPAFGH